MTFSLAGRMEGISASDILEEKPGYVIAIEPGVSLRNGKHSFSLFVPYNFVKNRN